MAKNKTTATDKDVYAFIEEFVDNEQKKTDSHTLIEIMSELSGHPPKMWGPSIIGFGRYHYVYKSGHSGDAPLIGFSPRKSAISLYVFTGLDKHMDLVQSLGKFKMGKACIYVKKLSDIDIDQLKALMTTTIQYLNKIYPEQ